MQPEEIVLAEEISPDNEAVRSELLRQSPPVAIPACPIPQLALIPIRPVLARPPALLARHSSHLHPPHVPPYPQLQPAGLNLWRNRLWPAGLVLWATTTGRHHVSVPSVAIP